MQGPLGCTFYNSVPMQALHYTRAAQLPAILAQRIVILDGAMGTMIQRFKLGEAQYRGEGYTGPDGAGDRFKDFPRDVKGNNELLSLTRPDVNDPGARNIDFETLRAAYYEQTEALVEGGADVLLVETIFDTLNAKAALFAIDEFFEKSGERLPLIISGTVTDASGRILSGQTVTAFWHSVRHARPLAIGLNCALGATLMRPYIQELNRVAEDTFISCYPNAGLPNPMSDTGFDETPEVTSRLVHEFAAEGLVNIVGGCCGTTPDHIGAIAKAVEKVPARKMFYPAEV